MMGSKVNILFSLWVVISVLFLNSPVFHDEVFAMSTKRHVILLGASVGQAWKIDSLPDRLKDDKSIQRYRFEYVGDFQFDKTQTLKAILHRKQDKPDAIILKECAVYFPGDFQAYQDLMKKWVTYCRKAGVVPIPTTVVPVIRDRSMVTIMKDIIKPLLGKTVSSDRLKTILQYNDWIRSYAKQEGLTVLDLEAALRISQEDRSLRPDLHSGDGLHLNSDAYTLLDQMVIPIVNQAFKVK